MPTRALNCRAPRRTPAKGLGRGFTLVEAMVAISITALAGSLILLAVETSLRTTNDSVEETLALGLAQQLVDEIAGQQYHGLGESPTRTPLGPSSFEAQGQGRERYDDIGDYHGYTSQPPQDMWGKPIGEEDGAGGLRNARFRVDSGYFARWRQRVEVYYVSDSDLSVRLPDGQTSNHRGVAVFIERVESDGAVRPLAQINRVFAYVPTLP
jgi:type II secretory pathway pseudopilin PulG